MTMRYHFQSEVYPDKQASLTWDNGQRLYTFEYPACLRGWSVTSLTQATTYVLGNGVFDTSLPDTVWVPDVSLEARPPSIMVAQEDPERPGMWNVVDTSEEGKEVVLSFYNIMVQPASHWTTERVESFLSRPGRVTEVYAPNPVLRDIVLIPGYAIEHKFRCTFEHPINHVICGPFDLKHSLLKWNKAYNEAIKSILRHIGEPQRLGARSKRSAKKTKVEHVSLLRTAAAAAAVTSDNPEESSVSDNEKEFWTTEAKRFEDAQMAEERQQRQKEDPMPR